MKIFRSILLLFIGLCIGISMPSNPLIINHSSTFRYPTNANQFPHPKISTTLLPTPATSTTPAALLPTPATAQAQGEVLRYALISGETDIYSDSLLTRPISTLPATYFVILLQTAQLYYHVSYADISGYISPSSVEIVDYEPVTKFATPVFRVSNDGYPATLRSAPDHLSSNKLAEIPAGSSGIYYGTAFGSSIITEVGNLWYYVKLENGATTLRGYVYKTQITVAPIEPNIIQKVEPPPDTSAPNSPFEFDDLSSVIIILALTLPAVLIMLLIFRKKPAPKTPRFDKDD